MVKELVPAIFGFSLCFPVEFRLIDSPPVYRRIDKMSMDMARRLFHRVWAAHGLSANRHVAAYV